MINKKHNKNSKLAFSLIELSVVILIIGVLVLGVTQGSRMMKQSKITAAISGVNFNGTAGNYFGGSALKTSGGSFTLFAVLENYTNASSWHSAISSGNGSGFVYGSAGPVKICKFLKRKRICVY